MPITQSYLLKFVREKKNWLYYKKSKEKVNWKQ